MRSTRGQHDTKGVYHELRIHGDEMTRVLTEYFEGENHEGAS